MSDGSKCIDCGKEFDPSIWMIWKCKDCHKKTIQRLAKTPIRETIKKTGKQIFQQ